jgi:gamma-glutamylcyclotransferase (GGCT)/AIG2-like uncharacterized protein YtfP
VPTPLPLFVYGTLRSAELRTAVLGHEAPGIAATARGHRTVYYPGRTYPALLAASRENTPGLLLENLTPFDLSVLDVFEGDEYERRGIKVRVDGRLRPAEVYWPVVAIAADAPAWRYEDWLARHADAMILADAAGAAEIRARLIAAGAGPTG